MVLFYLSVLIFIYGVYLYLKSKHNFWKQKGVKGPEPLPIVGNFGKVLIMQESIRTLCQNAYEQYPNEKIVGLYRGYTPTLLLRDPELIKQVLIKDFDLFQDRGMSTSRSKLGKNLFEADGETWRVLRHKLTPVFTSKKLKDMIPLVEHCIDNYIHYVDTLIEKNIHHEIRSLKSKYTLQVIGSCAFGLQLNTFSDKEDEFSIMAKRIFNPKPFSKALMMADMIIPGIRKLFNTATDVQDFFLNLISNVIKQREHEPMKRKDFMDLLIQLREQGKVSRKSEDGILEIELDDGLIAAQALIFYAAGFETSSASMSFMVYELSLHQDIQDKIYEEIIGITAKYNGKITYESIKEMIYLDMVFDETLRKHAVAGLLIRKSLADYTMPDVNVYIPKGMPIFIPVSGLQLDKKYYHNPKEFNPENFSAEKKAARPPCTYLPFGEGPRNCIGMRFAKVQSLMGMAAFLRKFRVEPSAKTKAELNYKTTALTLESKDGIWVKISRR
ncbi:cytochrome P450 6B7-like [Plodia interpunctella]|uniref:cytochrome P450 6B7-like n=1 Tax=Plodia interpunctella TaxID=58824 RepID=UPI0023683F4D|nr:cytochrome P450 6B7-like [Plodia interpunctella]